MKKWFKKLWEKIKSWFGEDDALPPAPTLVYRYGGFRGDKAVEDPETQIGGFSINRQKLSYKWTKGDLSKWGVTDPGDAGKALACAFFWSERERAWIGGKYDWISSNRLTRGLENIYSRYNGWDPDEFWAAPRRAFCIVDKAGNRRTNLVVS